MPVKRTNASPKKKTRRADTYQTAKTRETHDRILQSGRSIARREGLRAASIPRVMKNAGLTVGGFYAHFTSKEAIEVEIVRTMLSDLPGRWLSGLENKTGLQWTSAVVRRYLNAAHRDDPDEGCAYPAVLSEIARATEDVRQAFVESMSTRVNMFEQQVPPFAGATSRQRALATMALTIGGLLLARASRGSDLSDEFLKACSKWCLPELSSEGHSPAS